MAADPSLPSFRLRPPPLPGQVLPRPQVRNAILATPPGSTCVISAAPGYGATTALVQALYGSADDVCWVSLDASVADGEAIDLFLAAIGGRSEALADVCRTLAEGGSSWVVVDGLDPDVHQRLSVILGDVVDRLPVASRLVVTTHHDLPWPTAQKLDEELLECSEDEALELLSLIAENVHIDQASDVIRLAQGWVTALVAASRHLRTEPDVDRLTSSLPSQLLGAWFDGLSTTYRDFLNQTAILDLLAEGPAVAITGRSDVAELLTGLQVSHCFVRACPAPPGHSGRWWRRHPLLTALLRQRMSGYDFVGAHGAAASWFAQTSDVYSAMQHMLAAGRYTDAASYLGDHEVQLLSTGQAPQVLQWYDELAQARAHEIDALVRAAWAMVLARDIVGADVAFARLQSALAMQRAAADATAHDEQLLAAWAGEEALLAAYLAAFRGDPATVVAAARRAMEAPGLDRLADLAQLAPILLVRGLLWSGRPDEAEGFLQRMPPEGGVNPVMREVHLAGARALMLCGQGRIREAETVVRASQEWSALSGLPARSLQIFAPDLAHAWVLAESGILDEAQSLAQELLTEAADRGHIADATWAALVLSKAQMARGDYGAALRSVTRARELAVSRTPGSDLLVPVHEQQALVHMATGDFIRAERVIRMLPPGSARVLLAARAGVQQQPSRARRMLEAMDTEVPRASAQRHLLLAAVHLGTSRGLARGHLLAAATIAADNGLRILLSPPISGIAELAADTALETADASLEWLLPSMPGSSPGVEARVTKLSRGELQLLALLPTRAKNVDIADHLGVSVNTVKTRLRRLYAKLGAGSRDEAILNAKGRGLLD